MYSGGLTVPAISQSPSVEGFLRADRRVVLRRRLGGAALGGSDKIQGWRHRLVLLVLVLAGRRGRGGSAASRSG
jgi:hypothetical protein